MKELREKRGISQADIARGVHLTRSAVGYYETGKRGASNNQTWQKLADYFNVSVPYLQGYVDEYIDIHDLNEEEQDAYNRITDMLCEESPEDSISWSKIGQLLINSAEE
ncbi:XRE family transcriptional regulator [Lactobacillus gasseri]|nr:XRE family transcriptional regulator [Lactobacillus gasseri]RGL17050.1 XRE family transcriptional regulator [Lactobacillus gasseri]